MGTADRLNRDDLAIAMVRNTSGAALNKDQMFAMANAFAKVLDEFYQSNQDLIGIDKAAELADECALTIDAAYEYVPSLQDVRMEAIQRKYDERAEA